MVIAVVSSMAMRVMMARIVLLQVDPCRKLKAILGLGVYDLSIAGGGCDWLFHL